MKTLLLIITTLMLAACAALPTRSAVTPPEEQPDQSAQSSLPTTSQLQELQPDFLYLAAQTATREGNRDLAIKLLSTLVGKDTTAIAPRMELTNLLMQSGRIDQAEQHIATLLSNPTLPDTQREQIQLAQYRILIARQHPDEALTKLNEFLHKHPTNDNARGMLASILAGQGNTSEALASIRQGLKQKETANLLLLQAQLMIQQNDLTNARIALLRMQKLIPDNVTPVLMLSALAQQSKQAGEAEELLRQYLTTHPGELRTSHALAQLLMGQKRVAEAILVYRTADQQSGSTPQTLQPLGMLYFQHQDYKEAAQAFRKSLAIQDDNNSRFYLAASLEAMGNNKEAASLYQLIPAGTALGTQAQIRLATIDLQKKEIKQAESRLLAILKEQPQQLDTHLLLANIRLNQKQYRQLLNETEPLLSMKKLPPQLLFNRAVAFEHFKDYKHVESTLNRVLKHNPRYPEALNFLGYTYADQGIKLDKARELITRALKIKPDDGYYLDSLAWVYYKSAKYDLAASTQQQAIKQISNDSVMHEHYGDILWRQGKHSAAITAWQKALELEPEQPGRIKDKINHGPQSDRP